MMFYGMLLTAVLCSSVGALKEDLPINETAEAHEYDKGNTSVTISDETLKNINSAHDLYSVLSLLGLELPTEEEPFIHAIEDNRTSLLRNFKNTYQYMANPEQATCNPEMTAVDLDLISDSDAKYYPSCVRVSRCGGCCPNKDLLACQPVASNKVIVKVIELNSKNSIQNEHVPIRSSRDRRRVKVDVRSFNVTVEEHTACACMCILKEKDCNLDLHTFDEAGCSCKCKHNDDEEKCKGKSSHIWDQNACQCFCRNKISCSTGQEFKHDTCACEAIHHGINWGDLFLRSKPKVRQNRKPVEVPLDF